MRTGMFSFLTMLAILWLSRSEMYGILKYDHSVLVGWGFRWGFCLLYTVLWITVKAKDVIEFVYLLCCIFRKEKIPVRVAHRSYTFGQALSHTSTERKCTRDRCPVSYHLTCNSCDQQYIGSLTQLIHDCVKEHLNNENVSVKKHIYSCQNKDYKGIDGKIIMTENHPANLRLYEEFYIRKCKPTLSSQEECSEFADLVF